MYLDIAICLILGLFLFLGWRTGLLRGLIGFVASTAALIIAIFNAKPLAKFLDKQVNLANHLGDLTGGNGKFISTLVCGVIIYILIRLLFFIISKVIKNVKEKSKAIDTIDKVLGLVLGTAKFLLVLCMVFIPIYLLSSISFIEKAINTWLLDKSVIGKFFYNLVIDLIIPLFGDLNASSWWPF